MAEKHLTRDDLSGKVIDCHSHLGVQLKMYLSQEYPYAQSAEGLYYRQLSGGVDVNVVFPFGANRRSAFANFFTGKEMRPPKLFSESPYKLENHTLMREVFDYRAELSHRFVPFVIVDPGRGVAEQLTELENLEQRFPIYGIKISPVSCQSPALELLAGGKPFLDFAQDRDIPFLFHATTVPNDEYSQASDILKIVDHRPKLRFCLAHCLIFHRELLKQANEAPNAWVDTSALKIQVDFVLQAVDEGLVSREDLIDVDFSDHRRVMVSLCEKYPNTIIWGSDSPAYTYHCQRKQGKDAHQEFAFQGRYEDEIVALNSLPSDLRQGASNVNTLDFLFGRLTP